MSPIRILSRAKTILETSQFCLYNDPRYPQNGFARRADGTVTAPENIPAVMFTLSGAVIRAIADLSQERWNVNYDDYYNAISLLQQRISFNDHRFLRECDKMGKEKCLKLLDEVLEI